MTPRPSEMYVVHVNLDYFYNAKNCTDLPEPLSKMNIETDRKGSISQASQMRNSMTFKKVIPLHSQTKQEITASLNTLEQGFQAMLFPNNNVLPKINVLVVEDNVINQIILSNFLKINNIPYKLIANGRDALKEWRKGGYQLILMDIQLPFISGIYCAKEIRRLESVNSIGLSNQKNLQNIINNINSIPTNSAETIHTEPVYTPPAPVPLVYHTIEEEQDLPVLSSVGNSPGNTPVRSSRANSIASSSNGTIAESDIEIELTREDSPNPLTDEFASDKLDISKFRQPVIIVALTANSFTEDRDHALAAGCNDFLVKPVNLLWLGKKFAEWGCMQALITFDTWKHNQKLNNSQEAGDIKKSRVLEDAMKRLLIQ